MTERQKLMKQIMEYGFAVTETAMFLDTHPDNQEAIAAMKKYTEKKNELTSIYEKKYGPIRQNSAALSNEKRWTWIDSPWPWEGANN